MKFVTKPTLIYTNIIKSSHPNFETLACLIINYKYANCNNYNEPPMFLVFLEICEHTDRHTIWLPYPSTYTSQRGY